MGEFSYFILCGCVFSLVLNIIYISKRHIKSKETQVFSILLIVNLISLASELLCCYIGYYSVEADSLISHVVTKFYLISLMTFLLYMTLYIYVICYVTNKDPQLKYYKKLEKISYLIYAFCVIVEIFLPISTNRGYAVGLAVNFVYLCSTLALLEWTIPFIKNIKTINKKKAFPLILFIIFMVIVSLIQKVKPEITLITVMEFLIIFIMYNTIENPDVKMLEEYHKSREIAEQSNNEKAVFLLNISQELKRPANNINKLAIELKQEANDLNEDDIVQYSEAIKSQSLEILRTVNNVLDISDLRTQDLKLVSTKYPTKSLFNQIVKMTSGKINDNVDFQVSIDESIPDFLYGDSIRLKESLKMLLDNSIASTSKGFIAFSVKSVVKNDICRLIINVEDSGLGLSSEQIRTIFDEKNGNKKINLWMVRNTIALMGGTITVNSEIGKGSKFIVVLDQLMTNENKLLKKLDDRYMNNKNVLIIDYDIKTIKSLKKNLKHYDCVITEALQSSDGINMIRNGEKFDLIFIREDMPKLTGDDIIFKLKQIKGFKTPIVMLIKTNKNTKYDEYIVTPIKKSLLQEVVDDYLK